MRGKFCQSVASVVTRGCDFTSRRRAADPPFADCSASYILEKIQRAMVQDASRALRTMPDPGTLRTLFTIIQQEPVPTLIWIGKGAVVNHHLQVPFHILKDVPELACGQPGEIR